MKFFPSISGIQKMRADKKGYTLFSKEDFKKDYQEGFERRKELLKSLTDTGKKDFTKFEMLKQNNVMSCDSYSILKQNLQNELTKLLSDNNGKVSDTGKEIINMIFFLGSKRINVKDGKYEAFNSSILASVTGKGQCIVYSKFIGEPYQYDTDNTDNTDNSNANALKNNMGIMLRSLKRIKYLMKNNISEIPEEDAIPDTELSEFNADVKKVEDFFKNRPDTEKLEDIAATEAAITLLTDALKKNNPKLTLTESKETKPTQGGRKSKKARKGRKGRRTKNKRKRQTKKKRGKKRH